jgi:two-component system, cell cycle sensor histidine kinase and response regulator CckA
MLPGLLGEDVQLKVNTSLQDCVIYSDKGLIEQAIMNLVVNARDAMPKGGRLTVETGLAHLDDAHFHTQTFAVKPGNYVMLAVTDTGIGMDEKTRAQIFEPFFTTKEPGKGTGLGLSTVYAIAKQSQGYVWANSELGHGTTFKMYFPLAQAKAENEIQTVAEDMHHGGTETVLLVEDELALRMATAEFLESRGYSVLPVADAVQALKLAESQDEKIDLLLTDLVMPGLGGAELARTIIGIRPAIGVIYMSGFTEDTLREELGQGSVLLQKPFSLLTLANIIRKVLENKGL